MDDWDEMTEEEQELAEMGYYGDEPPEDEPPWEWE